MFARNNKRTVIINDRLPRDYRIAPRKDKASDSSYAFCRAIVATFGAIFLIDIGVLAVCGVIVALKSAAEARPELQWVALAAVAAVMFAFGYSSTYGRSRQQKKRSRQLEDLEAGMQSLTYQHRA